MKISKLLKMMILMIISFKMMLQCGMNTHIEVSLRALEQINPKQEKIRELLSEHMQYIHSGSPFPDWGYLCTKYGATSEDTHWPNFIKTFIKYIHDNDIKNQDIEKYHNLLAFLIGVISHQEADVIWHWGSQFNENNYGDRTYGYAEFQGYLRSMSHLGSYCKDQWNSGTIPTCHTMGDVGGELYLASRSMQNFYISKWKLPVDDILNVYKILGYNISKLTLESCLSLFYVGSHLEWLVAELVLSKYTVHSNFLTENIHRYFQGGLDDMAYQVSDKWTQLINHFDNPYFVDQFVKREEKINQKHQQIREKVNSNAQLNQYKQFKTQMAAKYSNLVQTQYHNGELEINYKNITKETVNEIKREFIKHFSIYNLSKTYQEDQDQEQQQLRRESDQQFSLWKKIIIQSGYSYFGNKVQIRDNKILIGAPGLIVDSKSVGGVFEIDLPQEEQSRVESVEVNDYLLSQQNPFGQFGDNLLVTDINSDGVDDLIVSTPLYGDVSPADFFQGLFYTKKYEGSVSIFLASQHGITKEQLVDITIVNDFTDKTFYLLGSQILVEYCDEQQKDKYLILGSEHAYNIRQKQGEHGDIVIFKNIDQLIQEKINNGINVIKLSEGQRLSRNIDFEMFGKSIGCSQSKLFVGAPGARRNTDKSIESTGAVYVYDLNDNNKLLTTIECETAMSSFGDQLVVTDNMLVVGAKSQNNVDGIIQSGAVYLFKIDHLLQKQVNSLKDNYAIIIGYQNQARFGHTLYLKDQMLFVGCPYHNHQNTYEIGKIFIFHSISQIQGQIKVQYQNNTLYTVLEPQFQSLGRFGHSIHFNNDYLVVGAPFTFDLFNRLSGAVYIYKFNKPQSYFY